MGNKWFLKFYPLALSIIIFGVIFVTCAFATGPTGAPSVYQVSLSKFEIDNGVGSTPVTAFDSATGGTCATLDIASAASTTSSAGNFLSGLQIPDGAYSRVRPTPNGTFIITGSIASGGSTYYTTGAAGTTGCATNITGPAQPCTVSLTIPDQEWQPLGGTITVKDGIPDYKVRVKFNLSAGISLEDVGLNKEIFPQQPSVTVQLTQD